jgi:tRNA 2-thiouridine synthesizing protein A
VTTPPQTPPTAHVPASGDAVTAPAQVLDVPGLACVDLTPAIATSMRTLGPGEVLEVRTDDPAARVGIPAWCRLTRHRLLDAVESDPSGRRTTFHIARRES